MESDDQIRRLRAAAFERLVGAIGKVREARAEVKLYDQLLALHRDPNRSNIGSNMQMETAGKSRSTKISAGRARIDSKSRTAAVAANLSDGDIASITGASRQAVQKWHTGKMAIPKRHAKKLADRIPIESWPRLGD